MVFLGCSADRVLWGSTTVYYNDREPKVGKEPRAGSLEQIEGLREASTTITGQPKLIVRVCDDYM